MARSLPWLPLGPAAALALAALPLTGCGDLAVPASHGQGAGRTASSHAAAPATSGAPTTVVVQPGDTLRSIAHRNNTLPRTIIEANDLAPPYALHPGQRLIVPHPQLHLVVPGETVYSIARRYRVDASALVRVNDIPPPYEVHVGQALIMPAPIPRAPTSAPQASPNEVQRIEETSPTAAATLPGSGAVPPTLGTPSPPLASAGPPPATSASGDVVAVPLPAVGQAAVARPIQAPGAAATPAPAPAISAPGSFQEDTAEEVGGANQPPASPPETKVAGFAPAAGVPGAARSAAAGTGLFLWPLQGKILSGYGPKEGGLFNDGINIAAKRGQIVIAAGAGTVVYAGNEIRGFGNLVLIKHPSGWVTAYAHNDRLLVRRGERVKRGQPIAKVGTSGGVSSPQLHFEVRKGSHAVDPLKYLGPLPT